MAKGDLMWGILVVIGGSIIEAVDLFLAISTSPYGASLNQIQQNSGQVSGLLSQSVSKEDSKQTQKKRYNNLIYNLKQQGLLEEIEKSGKKFFRLTLMGKIRLKKLQEKSSLPTTHYTREKDDRFVIVMFDIPEKERRKRAWLRAVLINLGFSMAQKSVWMGKVRIPHAFIDDLVKLDLDDFVEIFQVTKAGNLKHVI